MPEPAADLRPVSFSTLDGWAALDAAPVFATFRRNAAHHAAIPPKTRALGIDGAALAAIHRRALDRPPSLDPAEARAFFEAHFEPVRVVPRDGEGFLTGYFEPELEGTRRPDPRFPVALLARPDDLVDVDDHNRPDDMDPSYAFARRTADGLVPCFDRAAIEDGALAGRGLELVFLADPIDAYFVHVQGSVRVRLIEGGVARLAYAAKAGHPYASIGRLAIERGLIPAEEMTLARLRALLAEDRERGRVLMRENRSFVFFREQDDLDPDLGAIAAAGVQLTPDVSLAVDRTLHTFGTPIFVDADLPLGPDGALERRTRLMLADDTGSAIVGPARGDLFLGLGPEAERRAGRVRHAPRAFVVLRPKGEGTP
ncbi:MAG: MltA domain-containing protein [Siculibacillus sp.]